MRVDDGVVEGGEVSPLYDPMVAKLIVRGEDREQAIRRALVALSEFRLEGIHTNLPLLSHVLRQERFTAGGYTTALLELIEPLTRTVPDQEMADLARVVAALGADARARKPAASSAAGSGQGAAGGGWSPWAYDGIRRQIGGMG